MDPLLKTSLLRTLGFVLLLALSPWLFVYVEHTEKENKEEKYQLLLSLYESMASKYNMTIREFNNFSNVAHEALSDPKPQWTYINAMEFVYQALTTIGYGFITPQTPAGQILCIFVSLLGIPITLLTLKSVGELIAKWVSAVVKKFEKKILKKAEPKQVQTKTAVMLIVLMVISMVANGFWTMSVLDWTFVEGLYFWFVTMSTIGFGDYVIWQPQRIKQSSFNSSRKLKNKDHASVDTGEIISDILFQNLLTLYSLVGLCIVASVLNSIMAAIEERKCRAPCPRCIPRKTQDHADNEQYNTAEQREADITCLNMENYGSQKKNVASFSVTEIS